MKVIWELSDISAGRRIGHPTRSERWLIGYRAGVGMETNPHWSLISLSDGMVMTSNFETKSQLADRLNKNGEVPEEWL